MRAQFWSFDVIFAMAIFGTSLMLLTYVWYNISNQYSLAYGVGSVSMQAQLEGMQSRLLLPGSPSDWNYVINMSDSSTWSNVSVGLGAGSGGGVSANKMLALSALSSYNTTSYHSVKAMLGVGYDYYIRLNALNMSIAAGRSPSGLKAVSIQIAEVPVTVNGRTAELTIELWTNETFGVV